MEIKTKISKNLLPLDFHLHKCLVNTLCKVNFPKSLSSQIMDSSSSKMIIILDISGSMGQLVPKLIQDIIPSLLEDLYQNDPNYSIDLVTFGDDANLYKGNANEIKSHKEIKANGRTFMAKALDLLYSEMEKEVSSVKNYRILSLSDGDLWDQERTVDISTKIKNLCIAEKLNVNSQAIRLYTSSTEPDTRGLSSMVQLSTKGGQLLNDIDCKKLNNKEIADFICNMFRDDGICTNIFLKNKKGEKIFQQETWMEKSEKINIFLGDNTFWINFDDKEIKDVDIIKYIQDNFEIDFGKKNGEIKAEIKCSFGKNIELNNFQEIIKDKIDFYLRKLKILKVVNTEESLKEIDSIINFFTSLEESLSLVNEANSTLPVSEKAKNFKLIERTQRIKLMIQKRKSSISNIMKSIKNDDKVNQLNSKQQAEYLRSIDLTDKTGKGLAKRAFAEGTEFDETIRQEIKQIHDHFNELSEVNVSILHESFYSTCNTLDGIKAVCQLYEDSLKDGTLEEITANDILKLINIVGVSAFAEIGNYPDPMTYRLNKLYPSSFISISDILIVHELTQGQSLTEIGNKENKINTAIPYFEDEKILKFLLKYSPKLLEYSASVGMRRILADVPYTNEYTTLSGIWKLISMIIQDKSKKEIYSKVFVTLVNNYLITSGDHFLYVLDLLDKQKEKDKDGLSIYIAYNGITNMVAPLLLYQKSHSGKEAEEMVQRIIRATYQYEANQYIRKIIKKQGNDQEIFIKNFLNELLNINISENKIKPTEYFEENLTEPSFYENYSINEAKLDELYKKMWWIDFIVITPLLLKTAISTDPVEEFKKIEINEIDENTFKEKVGINFDMKLFKLFCVVQSFLQHEKADRCDNKLKIMKILDLGNFEKADRYVKDYVKKIFNEQYQEELKEKAKQELLIITNELVEKLIQEKEYNSFITLLKEGITKGVISYKINDPNSSGFIEFYDALVKTEVPPLRDEKLYVLITGYDFYNKEEIIFNKGNFWKNKKAFMAKNILSQEIWEKIMEKGGKATHIYRALENRQGHSNEKVSYWAMGYKDIEEFKSTVSKETFDDYVKEHQNCCGFFEGKYCIMRRKDRKKGK